MSVLTLQQPVEVLQSRPWLALYGVMLRPRRSAAHVEDADLAPIQRCFPEEMMNTIFSYLGPYELGRAACVCGQWRHLTEHTKHWQAACQQAYGACHKDVTCSQELVRKAYRCSWRRLFLDCPHLRFDGLYASRNTYIRQGVSEWKRDKGSCFLVTYFRYFRFFPDGTLLYRTSPLTIGKVAKSMMRNPCEPQQKQKQHDQHVFTGRYVIKGGKVFIIIVYPNSHNTEVRARCRIRGLPVLGAANRLDLEELASFDREEGSSASIINFPDPDEDPSGSGSVTSYKRGLSPCVFVTWQSVADSPLNLPAREMDFWMPG